MTLNRARELLEEIAAGGRRRGCRRSAPLGRRLVRLRGRVVGGRAGTRARRIRGASRDRLRARASERRAVGVTVEGVPVELVVAEPARVRHGAPGGDRNAGLRRGTGRAAGRSRREGRVRAARHPLVSAGAARGAVPRRAADAVDAQRHSRRPPHALDMVGREGVDPRDGDGSARARLRVRGDLRPHAERACRPGPRRGRLAAAGRGDRSGQRRARAVPRPARHRSGRPRATARSTCRTTCSRSSNGCSSACMRGNGKAATS